MKEAVLCSPPKVSAPSKSGTSLLIPEATICDLIVEVVSAAYVPGTELGIA